MGHRTIEATVLMRVQYPIAILLVVGAGIFCGFLAVADAQSVNITATAETLCGDGIVQSPEQCDGANLNGTVCTNLGYAGGTLSCASNCVFDTAQCTSTPLPDGSHSGGTPFSLEPAVIFSGRAHPFATIVISEGSAIKSSVSADAAGVFQATIDAAPGSRSFSVYAIDKNGLRTPKSSFSITVSEDSVGAVAGIFLPPTIGLNGLRISGFTVPHGTVSIYIDSDDESAERVAADASGSYSLLLDTDLTVPGSHTLRVKVAAPDLSVSGFSETLSFVLAPQGECQVSAGDLNCDAEVDLADLSILMYWWRTPPQGIAPADLNRDRQVNLVDLSMMLANWTA